MAAQGSFELRIHPPFLPEDREEIASFLSARGLGEVEGADFTVCLLEGGRLLATASLVGSVVMGMAVDESLRGSGLTLGLLSELEAEAARRGVGDLLVFTKPEHRGIFESLGYAVLAESEWEGQGALLLEKGGGFEDWLARAKDAVARLPSPSPEAPQAAGQGAAASAARGAATSAARAAARGAASGAPRTALVMNCNPFTLGHRYLVERAAESSSSVVVIAVEEDASAFPAEVRLRLIREGTADLPGVAVVPGSRYAVSRATFPSYFLKDPSAAPDLQARLDCALFGGRIAPALGITRRMAGEEPYCAVTARYNAAMRDILPPLGVGLTIIPRLASGGEAVSASTVRRLIREGRLEETRALVPESTYRYLISPEAAPVLARVRLAGGRH